VRRIRCAHSPLAKLNGTGVKLLANHAKLHEQEAILEDRIDLVMDCMLKFHFLESNDQSYQDFKRKETFVLIHKLNGVMHARHIMLKPTRVSMWKSLYRGLNGNVDLIKLIVDLALEA
jgi:hypothetical protein